MNKSCIRTSVEDDIGIIQLFRPHVANALNRSMVLEVVEQMEAFDQDKNVRVIVLKGNEKAFAAGADIEEMLHETALSFELQDPFRDWDRLLRIKKPIIAAVEGFALGGGFELALHCDLIIASEQAQFGFPEIKLGVLPGAGGTQLLTRAMGTRKALEWIWLGEFMSVKEAHTFGIVNRIVAPELVVEETIKLAKKIAKQAPIAVRLIKEAVIAAEDLSLQDGMKLERKNFYLAFDSADQKEGMRAFLEKRTPSFKGG
ncbi:enoyl-CoA hydratase/isomerase family protein [Virgibacillus soli]|uniref:Enoyl-CoA hydratase-related protein n=1 Tax=Paracerasibacillus soli TaxID=480284 RepID=A0ABU5CTM5_9BACI|nr:enoyl-CoA hydratase-related protein [Virgibacillus soli]MDY0409610.1 enoyl-CoA hydratase-related protein [Virgibacillus soli]